MRTKLVFAGIVAFATACATGGLVETEDDSGSGGDSSVGGDASGGDGGGCPQFNLQTDHDHCGTCTHACASTEVCSSGTCQSSCQAPTTKCTSDAGVVCANTQSDTDHCGSCTNECNAITDAGLAPGSNNPDAGVVYDSGTGWSLGSPECEGGACGTTCTQGMTACSGVCFDTQNFHDHCGDCNTACTAQTEWCNAGHCCGIGQEYCGSACTDVLGDKNNCGSCGHACSGGTPNCSNGACTATCSPSGTRQAFNTLGSNTTTGCWTGDPCLYSTYLWDATHGASFINANEQIACSGTTACVAHVGITTYELTGNCQGAWDVYCDATKVGTINTTSTACQGDPMTNGCSITFSPVTCSAVKLVGTTGSVGACCGSTGLHSMVTAVSAW